MPEDQKPKEITMTQLAERPGALTPFGAGGLAPSNFTELVAFAKMVANSGMLPKSYDGKYEAAVVAMQMGAELGLTPMAAVRSIAVINGHPALWGDGLLALVRSDPRVLDVIEVPQQEIAKTGTARCTVRVRNRADVTCELDMAWAKRAGLLDKKGPWQNYPARMLQMRARAFACRDAVPDRLSGIACAEEAQDIDMGPAEYVDPATDLPPEGVSKFGGKPAPGDESPAAGVAAKEAIAKIDGIGPGAGDTVIDQLRQIAAYETRSTVVNAAQAKLEEIEGHRAKPARNEPESGAGKPGRAGAAESAPQPNVATPSPGPDMPDWDEEPHDPVTGEVVQGEIGF